MFDPDAGAAYASQFLKSLYAERGDWSLAAGAYHSQTPERAGVYRARFDRILAGLAGRPLAVVAAAEPERVDAAPAAPKKSRTRMSKGPKIITVPKRVPAPSQEALGRGRRARGADDAGGAGVLRQSTGDVNRPEIIRRIFFCRSRNCQRTEGSARRNEHPLLTSGRARSATGRRNGGRR